ncbi:MAG: peptidoglycan DD-metalloendopeptidase family protein [Patescibacteria group bacterium]|nr:peptidoglycan DD-metalloendopeptidase family protein [Patescibacteria group bacterium]
MGEKKPHNRILKFGLKYISNFGGKLKKTSLWLANFEHGSNLKTRAKSLFLAFFFSVSTIMAPIPYGGYETASAASQDELNATMNQLNTEIDSLRAQIGQKRNEKDSLANEIAIFDAQIQELTLKIQATDYEITRAKSDITWINNEVVRIQKEIAKEKDLLKENIRVLYEQGNASVAEMVASSNNFSEYLDKTEYLYTLQNKITDTLARIEALKKDLEQKKQVLEAKKKDLEKLQKQQNGQMADLNNQRAQKDALLAQTAGEEANFQAILDSKAAAYRDADAQLKAILSRPSPSVSSGSSYIPFIGAASPSYGSIARGTIIGYQGNTGFSSGSHLHFGVYIGDQDVEPDPYLNSGQISYPEDSFYISQGYWGTFSHRGVGWPGGLDMVSYYGAPIRAAADGNIIFDGYMPNGFGHYIIMEHGNGLRTLYGHMQ